jgi:hypothetical protein
MQTREADRLGDVASYIRSKNAGPFWLTIDIFFADEAAYEKAVSSRELSSTFIGELYGVAPEHVHIFKMHTLLTVKISFPRINPSGGFHDRDIHGGQQYLPLARVTLSDS